MKWMNYAVFFLFLMWVAVLVCVPVRDNDIWFNLKSGDEILRAGTVFDHDIFSFTREGAPWINRLWLFQVMCAAIFSLLSAPGLIALKMLFMVLVYYILLVPYRKEAYFPLIVLVAVLSALVLMPRVLVRPELVSFLFLALNITIVQQFLRHGSPRILYVLPIVNILWINMHGLYVLGFVIDGIALSVLCIRMICVREDRQVSRRRCVWLLGTVGLSCAALFVNPFGLRAVMVPFEQFAMISGENYFRGIRELVPVVTLLKQQGLHQPILQAGIFCVVVLCTMVLAAAMRKLSIFHVMLVGVFIYLACKANRNMALLAIICIPVVAESIRHSFLSYKTRAVLTGGTLCIICVLFGIQSRVVWAQVAQTGLDAWSVGSYVNSPQYVCDFFETDPGHERIYANRMLFGNYYLWRFGPQKKVFWDGRLEVYGEDFYKKGTQSILSKEAFFNFIDSYAFDTLVFAYRHLYGFDVAGQLYQRIKEIYDSPSWQLVYVDIYYIVFMPSSKVSEGASSVFARGWTPQICETRIPLHSQAQDIGGRAAEYYALAKIAFILEEYEAFYYFIALHDTYAPNTSNAVLLYIKAYMLAGNFAEAYDVAVQAYDMDTSNTQLLFVLSDLALKVRKFNEAVIYLQTIIKRYPDELSAHNMLANTYYAMGNFVDAKKTLEDILSKNPDDIIARNNYNMLRYGVNQGNGRIDHQK